MQGGRSEDAAVQRQVLRRGGIGGVRAQGGEGVRAEVGGGGGGEDEGAGRSGEGAEGGRRGGGVGPCACGGVRAEIERVEDGGD